MNIKQLTILSILLLNTSYAKENFLNDKIIFSFYEKKDKTVQKRFQYFQKTLLSLKDKKEEEKLESINNFFNEIPYGSDKKIYGKSDYWATPFEMLSNDKGDCEDYVIAKYFSLIHLGIDKTKLFFSYVTSTNFKEPHMVLSYYETPNSDPLILDNNNLKIFKSSERKDLKPIYHLSFVDIEENKINNKIYEKYVDLKTRIEKYLYS